MIKRFLVIICFFCLVHNFSYAQNNDITKDKVPEFQPIVLPPVETIVKPIEESSKIEGTSIFKPVELPSVGNLEKSVEEQVEISMPIKEEVQKKSTKTQKIKESKKVKEVKVNQKKKEKTKIEEINVDLKPIDIPKVEKTNVQLKQLDTPKLEAVNLQSKQIETLKQEETVLPIETPTLKDVYKETQYTKTVDKNIFIEEDMEVIGKTFWGRKPIHPRAKYGYKGRLPDIALELDYKKTKDEYKSLIKTDPNATEKDLIPAPRESKAYVDIVIKKASSSEYVNDVNDVILILQKMIANIENNVNVQKFNAQVSGLLDNIFYIQDKYKDKPEGNYISLRKMLELATIARDTAILRTEAQAYSKYLAYSGEGEIYRPERIQQQMDYLLSVILETLKVLKAVN